MKLLTIYKDTQKCYSFCILMKKEKKNLSVTFPWLLLHLQKYSSVIECRFVLMTRVLYLWLVSEKLEEKKGSESTVKNSWRIYLMEKKKIKNTTILTGVFTDGKTFQNRKVSSPAPVTMVCMMQRWTTIIFH